MCFSDPDLTLEKIESYVANSKRKARKKHLLKRNPQRHPGQFGVEQETTPKSLDTRSVSVVRDGWFYYKQNNKEYRKSVNSKNITVTYLDKEN